MSEVGSMSGRSLEGSRLAGESEENAGGYSERIRGYEEYMKGEFGS